MEVYAGMLVSGSGDGGQAPGRRSSGVVGCELRGPRRGVGGLSVGEYGGDAGAVASVEPAVRE